MKQLIQTVTLAAFIAVAQLASANPITQTFATGDRLKASHINNFKSVINDHDTRIVALESATTSPNFGGYSTPFAADGAAKNVVLLQQPNGAGGSNYYVRSAYANSSETISINGVAQVVPYIFNYAFASTDAGGNLTSVSNTIEAPDTAGYDDYYIEQSTFDTLSLVKTVTADTRRGSYYCGGSASNVHVCGITITLSASGEFDSGSSWTSLRALGTAPFTVNGMTFADVRYREIANKNIFRVEAKGIGDVLRTTGGGTRRLIYYRVNGASEGSLAGTPFASGQPLDGLFF